MSEPRAMALLLRGKICIECEVFDYPESAPSQFLLTAFYDCRHTHRDEIVMLTETGEYISWLVKWNRVDHFLQNNFNLGIQLLILISAFNFPKVDFSEKAVLFALYR